MRQIKCFSEFLLVKSLAQPHLFKTIHWPHLVYIISANFIFPTKYKENL
nr:MAG TPA: hypothetical protein [Caudoviricetes sp.]